MTQVHGVLGDLLRMAAKSPAAHQRGTPLMIPLRYRGQTFIGAEAVRQQNQIVRFLHGKGGESGPGRRSVRSRYAPSARVELESMEGAAQGFADHVARTQVRAKMRARRLACGQAAGPGPVKYDFPAHELPLDDLAGANVGRQPEAVPA